MKISFLVLVACLCLTAVSAKRKEHKEESSFTKPDGTKVDVEKITAVSENTDVKTYQEGDAVVEEEVKTIRTSIQGRRKGKRKLEKWVEAAKVPCSEILKDQEVDCLKGCSEFQDCKFNIKSEDTCEWDCHCEATVVEKTEQAVEEEHEIEGSNAEKRKRKVKKEASGAIIKKKKKATEGKECSGTKKFSFSNCLIKMIGIAGWGDEASKVDEEFHNMIGH